MWCKTQTNILEQAIHYHNVHSNGFRIAKLSNLDSFPKMTLQCPKQLTLRLQGSGFQAWPDQSNDLVTVTLTTSAFLPSSMTCHALDLAVLLR